MEKQGYLETLNVLREMFPGKLTLTVKEAADVMGANTCTVYEAVKRKYNPLPSKKLSGKIVIPIPAFASWLC
jgi:hypothetical protein